MDINGKKFLICDDSILARKQIKDIVLEIGEPTIIEAVDGDKCVQAYKEHQPDIVFLDIVMPIKDGNIAIEEIMGLDKDALIIVVSSVGTQSQLKCALEAGATDFIQKPIYETQVVDAINKYLKG